MSFIRLASPGQPTRTVDLGPAYGRTSHTRIHGGNRSIIAGELVSGASGDATQQRHAEMKRIRLKSQATERQAEVLRIVTKHNGNRAAAARELGVTAPYVVTTLTALEAKGIDVPPLSNRRAS